MKYLSTTSRHVKSYYWRNSNKREIDLIEEEQGFVSAYEIKYSNKKRPRVPVEFERQYPGSAHKTVNPTNFNTILFDASRPDQTKLFP